MQSHHLALPLLCIANHIAQYHTHIYDWHIRLVNVSSAFCVCVCVCTVWLWGMKKKLFSYFQIFHVSHITYKTIRHAIHQTTERTLHSHLFVSVSLIRFNNSSFVYLLYYSNFRNIIVILWCVCVCVFGSVCVCAVGERERDTHTNTVFPFVFSLTVIFGRHLFSL